MGQNSTKAAVYERLRRQYIFITAERYEATIRKLREIGSLEVAASDALILTKITIDELKAKSEQASAVTRSVQERFEQLFLQHCPTLGQTGCWESFREEALLPFLEEMSDQMLGFLKGSAVTVLTPEIEAYVSKRGGGVQAELRSAVLEFFDPAANGDVHTYVSWTLNGSLSVTAAGLSAAEIALLSRTFFGDQKPKIFLDSNTVISVLGFHDHPKNELTQKAMDVLRDMKRSSKAEILISDLHAREVEEFLSGRLRDMKGFRLSPAVARGGLEAGTFKGIAARMAEVCVRSAGPMTIERYLEPYITGLDRVLEGKGIRRERANLTYLKDDARVGRATVILTRMKEEARSKRVASLDDRHYHNAERDALVFNYALDISSGKFSEGAETRVWLLTLDEVVESFESQDRTMGRGAVVGLSGVRLSVSPERLLGMLHFLIPRNHYFEEAVMSAIRTQLIPDPSDQKGLIEAVLRIASRVSRYESPDLDADVARKILLDQALVGAVEASGDDRETQEVIMNAVIAEMTREQRIRDESIRSLRQQLNESDEARDRAETVQEILKSRVDLAVTASLESDRKRSSTEEALALEKDRGNRLEIEHAGKLFAIFATIGFSAALVLGGALSPAKFKLASVALISLLGAAVVNHLGKRNIRVSKSTWFVGYSRRITLVYGVIGIAGVAANVFQLFTSK